jgi:hypothetical protein
MWHKDKEWLHFVKNSSAVEVASAFYLATYLKLRTGTGKYNRSFEIIDINRRKIKKCLSNFFYNRKDKPFVFVVGKN